MKLRTEVFAYVQRENPVLKKAEDFDFVFFCFDNLNRVVAAADVEHFRPKSAVAIAGVGGAGKSAVANLILIDHQLREADKAILSGLVMSDAPLVVGPRAANEFTWHLKAEANSRGRIFEVADTNAALEKVFETSLHAVRRRFELWASHFKPESAPSVGTDPLAALPGVLEVSHSLRSPRGRLDAEKVRDLFTLTRADLARITGIQEETIRQTPDSDRLQPALQGFDRVARMLVLNPDRAKFATWLNAPNDELDQRTPLELIKERRLEVIETLVHDILTNRGR